MLGMRNTLTKQDDKHLHKLVEVGDYFLMERRKSACILRNVHLTDTHK